MGLFNVVIGGSALRPIPNPCYRTWGQGMSMPVRIPGVLNYGVYDGFRAFRGSTNWGPDLTKNTDIEELPAGLKIRGTGLRGGTVHGHGDHRIVMAMTVAGFAAEGPVTVDTAEAADITFPGFWESMRALGAKVE